MTTIVAVAALIGWMVALFGWHRCLNQVKALRHQLDPNRVVHQLNRGAIILPTDQAGPPREYMLHAELRDGHEFWVWS